VFSVHHFNILAAKGFIAVNVEARRRTVALYPIFLFYCYIGIEVMYLWRFILIVSSYHILLNLSKSQNDDATRSGQSQLTEQGYLVRGDVIFLNEVSVLTGDVKITWRCYGEIARPFANLKGTVLLEFVLFFVENHDLVITTVWEVNLGIQITDFGWKISCILRNFVGDG